MYEQIDSDGCDYTALFARHVQKLSTHGDEVRGCCPFHEDNNPSWSGNRTTGLWRCFGCNASGNAEQFATRLGDHVTKPQKATRPGDLCGESRVVAQYHYTDENGKPLFQVVRREPKGFSQEKADGKGGWITGKGCMDGVRLVLFRLPNVLSADTIYLTEGEKDAIRLHDHGLVATTNPGGAGKWQPPFSTSLQNKHVVIIPDHDVAGEKHAQDVARSLLPVAAPVKIVRLPGLPPLREKHGEDVSDWLDAEHTKDELLALVKATPPLRAADLGESETQGSNPWEQAKDAPSFLAEEEVEFKGLAKDLLAPGAITLLAAPRGLGKTQVSHAVAVALATGGYFRGEKVPPVRVLLLDRDNPDPVIRGRLRSWGAAEAPHLRVLTRQNAPDLKDKAAWSEFPIESYDVLIIDSVGSSAEGVTEREGKQTTEILATILDLARKGLAILLLTNCTKDALSLKGRGEWADRADIIYEVRDATDFVPSGRKPWWQELPPAGEAAWAERAARRKGRHDFRLAFVPSKFRLDAEPEPFCLELLLPKNEPWTLTDVTEEILGAGEESASNADQERAARRDRAALALAKEVEARANTGKPILKTEAEHFLCDQQNLKRVDARKLVLDKQKIFWVLVRCADQKGQPQILLPVGDDTTRQKSKWSYQPPKSDFTEGDVSAAPMNTNGENGSTVGAVKDGDSRDGLFSPGLNTTRQKYVSSEALLNAGSSNALILANLALDCDEIEREEGEL